MKFRWTLPAPNPLLAGQLARALNLPPLLAQCLLNRGLDAPSAISTFLDPRLKQLADPFLLPNMAAAVERLLRAREESESLVIFGDYDVDGVTSTALLFEVLSSLGWSVNFYLPHRMDEGYGLSQDAIENCLKKFPVTLLLAVDCGSTTVDSIAWLQHRGVDVIVLDHHQVSDPAPAACALVNPHLGNKEYSAPKAFGGVQCSGTVTSAELATNAKSTGGGSPSPWGEGRGEGEQAATNPPIQQSTNPAPLIPPPPTHPASTTPPLHHSTTPPFHELCSVGLSFKLAHALLKRARELALPGAADFDLRPLLDLVALGTIADLVPLTGENRILVSAGLERLNSSKRPGLIALKKVAKSPVQLGVYEVGFQLAPRLNAAGRLENAEQSLHLLLARDLAEASPLAQNLDQHNRDRQAIEKRIAAEVIALLRAKFNPDEHFVIVEGHAAWHLGVVGIVASRVLQQFYRPTIIVGGDGVEWRGSGRSIAGFDLAAALRECNDLLVRHGGHALAAGVTISPNNLEPFRARLNQLARQYLKPDSLHPPLRLDAEVGLEEITFDSLAVLDRLKPTGQGNPTVQFCARNVAHQRPLLRMGADKQHVKMWLTDGAAGHEAVWWNAGQESLPVGKFDLAFAPQINHYNGRQTIQLKVLDWRPSHS